METCKVVLTFDLIDKILWCDHSNETSSAVHVRLLVQFVFYYFTKEHFDFFFLILIFGTRWS